MTVHEKYMRRCLELAANGRGNVSPNPMVGSVIVHNNRIIGEGYHILYGSKHAEVNAVDSVRDKALLTDSTMYVSLEPCSHFGKQPPCCDMIVEAKIPRVVVGIRDTNPIVAGKGIERLIKAGVEVQAGCLEKECRDINIRFFTYHEKQRPYIILKWAESADGYIDKIRSSSEKPSWITDETARTWVHKWRAEEDAIMVGTNTALMDNPVLNVRNWHGNNPIRMVFDRTLRLPTTLALFDGTQATIVFTEREKEDMPNLEYIKAPFNDHLLAFVMRSCFDKRVLSLVVEGGARLINSFIAAGLWDEARVFTGEERFGSGVKAPVLPVSEKLAEEKFSNSILRVFRKKQEHA